MSQYNVNQENSIMKVILTLTAFLAFLTAALGQSKPNSTNIDIKKFRWANENYTMDRDSAYANPYIGIQKLVGGNRRFVEGKSIKPRQNAETLQKLEDGQAPFATIVGCSDSRVPNELIFDQGLGDLFIIRTAGQVSAAASYGSMEFATLKLKTKLIVVLGHTECGAVAAAVERPEDVPGHIVTLINEIKSAVSKSANKPGNKVENAVRQNVIEQVNSLRDLEPILSKKYKNGELLIVGALYDIHSGKVEFLEETLVNLPRFKRM